MTDIIYIDRSTKQKLKEKVYGEVFIQILYGQGCIARLISSIFLPLVSRVSWLSRFYGFLQKSPLSKRKIKPFIEHFHIDPLEFVDPVETFCSFNDFFIRKLKKEVRPIVQKEDVLIMPADARYLVFPDLEKADGFWVKGKKFSLKTLIEDDRLSQKFAKGSMAMARLCPIDYHRFHFPCDGIPHAPRVINGPLYSVNPLALQRNIHILSENKRVLTVVETKLFGTILYVDVGATSVGSIHQTFTPYEPCFKGQEKGYFSFGGSCLLLFFEPGAIV
ncbi:MAG: phosphatidylserine decarboxylase, partial [Chlamydiales bacterium]|nr:phosphatidylserine decarboxylase [Chlamydiales bacterium]